MEQNEITGEIVSAAMKVHSALGPGLMESACKICLERELVRRGLSVERERILPIVYDGMGIDAGYRIDFLVESNVIVEVKAARAHPVYEAQLLSYLKLGGIRVGLLINFCVPSMRDGAAFLLAAVAFGAGLIPAWRAARVDPIEALREQ